MLVIDQFFSRLQCDPGTQEPKALYMANLARCLKRYIISQIRFMIDMIKILQIFPSNW